MERLTGLLLLLLIFVFPGWQNPDGESVVQSHAVLKCWPKEPEIPQARVSSEGDPNQLYHAPTRTLLLTDL